MRNRKGYSLLIVLVILTLHGAIVSAQTNKKLMEEQIGSRNLTVEDKENKITFPLFILYPSKVLSSSHKIGPYTVEATPNAPVVKGKHGLIIISHGSGGSHLAYLTIAQYLANNGFIVAMPEHYRNNRHNNALEGTMENLEYRPRHISKVIDLIFADPQLKEHIQKDQVAMIGHSMGGYTALAVVGGEPWSETRKKVKVVQDHRVKAAVLMAPATLWYTPDGSLDNVKVPIYMLIAEHDQYTKRNQAELVLDRISDRSRIKLREIKNAGHLSFLSPFPESMKTPGFLPAMDPEGFDREAFHKILNQDLLKFFRSVM